MLNKITLVGLILLFFFQLSCTNIVLGDKKDIEWVKEVSNAYFPKSTYSIATYNNNEWGVILKAKIKTNERDEFINKNKLSLISDLNELELLLLPEIGLEKLLETESDYADVYYKIVCTSKNICKLFYFKSKDLFLIEVLYPDFGGDLPDC